MKRAAAPKRRLPKDSGGRSRYTGPAYAAIDLGTNSCRMLVAYPSESGFNVVDGYSRVVRLGDQLTETGRLDQAAMDRTVAALQHCARRLARRRIGVVRAVATAACRQADNAEVFVERVSDETGIDLEVISPEEEAALTVAGCADLLRSGSRYTLVFDIGGGSTEVTWLETLSGVPARIVATTSLPLGVVTLRDEFGPESLPTPVYQDLLRRIDESLAPFDAANGIAAAIAAGDVCMIGTSGTVTTLGAMHLDLPRYNRSRVDGLELEFDSIRDLSSRLACMSSAERIAHPCLGLGRGDLMLMGLAILRAVCKRWPAGKLRIADRGIREGVLAELMAADGHDKFGPPLNCSALGLPQS